MIEYYLGEKPPLAQVPTWICAEREQRDYVLDHLAELVVKPIDGFGGNGVVIGRTPPTRRWRPVGANCSASPSGTSPRRRSRCRPIPTFDGEGMYPHHVDLRAFVTCGRDPTIRSRRTSCRPALTRVATRGSRIVNSSSGGGSKDTWILTDGHRPTGSTLGSTRRYVRNRRRDPVRRRARPTSPRSPG